MYVEYYSALKQKEILPFVTTWMDHYAKYYKPERDKAFMVSLIIANS